RTALFHPGGAKKDQPARSVGSVRVRRVTRGGRVLPVRGEDQVVVVLVEDGAALGAAVAVVIADGHERVLVGGAAGEFFLHLRPVARDAGDAGADVHVRVEHRAGPVGGVRVFFQVGVAAGEQRGRGDGAGARGDDLHQPVTAGLVGAPAIGGAARLVG